VREHAARLLEGNEVFGVVALRALHGRVAPSLITAPEELESLATEPRYPLAEVCKQVLAGSPQGRLGVVVRGCDERALVEMAKLGQLELHRLVLLGLACSAEQARECACARPYPSEIHEGERAEGVPAPRDERDVAARAEFWEGELERCIKCYGCRNVCPVCICDSCVLEEACWVERGSIPPSRPFHLIRVWHVADKCVGCGACEAVCPMDIPLRSFHAPLLGKLERLFGYEPGIDLEQRSPLTTSLEEAPFRE
jgi:ferredoxin